MFHPPRPPEPTEPPPSAGDPAGAEVPTGDVLAYVADRLAHGSTPAEVRKQLVAMGYGAHDANRLLQAAQAHQGWGPSTGAYSGTHAAKAAGHRNMTIGCIVCVVGLVITVGSLAAASSSGGGYVVAWGAIVFGAIQFFRGAAQAGGGSSEAR